MLHTKYVICGTHGFREEDFLSFSHYKSKRAIYGHGRALTTFFGKGAGAFRIGKISSVLNKIGEKCNVLCMTFLLLDFQKSSSEMILLNTNMFLYVDIEKIILHLSSNTVLVCSTQLYRTESNKEFHF